MIARYFIEQNSAQTIRAPVDLQLTLETVIFVVYQMKKVEDGKKTFNLSPVCAVAAEVQQEEDPFTIIVSNGVIYHSGRCITLAAVYPVASVRK